jgi:hypothetical protein
MAKLKYNINVYLSTKTNANFLNYDKQVDIIDRFQEQHYWNEVTIIDSRGFKIKEHLKTIFVGGIQTYKKARRFTGKILVIYLNI